MCNNETMRKRADWMVRADDDILELMRDLQASSPAELEKHLSYTKEYISRRLRELWQHQLIDRPARGIYRINENTIGYLNENVDASQLERREE